MPDTTFLFLYAHKSLEEVDASGPMHAAAGYRDAVGDGGRRQLQAAYQDGIEMTQTIHFRLRPGMSTLPKEWADTDAYWTDPQAPQASMWRRRRSSKRDATKNRSAARVAARLLAAQFQQSVEFHSPARAQVIVD